MEMLSHYFLIPLKPPPPPYHLDAAPTSRLR